MTYFFYDPRPADQSKVGQSAFFLPHSDLFQVTSLELIHVTMCYKCTTHIRFLGVLNIQGQYNWV